MVRTVHTREQHVLRIYELVLVRHHEVGILLRTVHLLLTLPYGRALFRTHLAHAALYVVLEL